MAYVKSIWKWLDGKKTAIGALLLILYGVPHIEEAIGPKYLDVIYYLGSGLSGSGIFHKITKAIKPSPTKSS